MKTLVYLGTPEISAELLKLLSLSNKIRIVGVVTQPGRPRGRKKTVSDSPVACVARELNIPVHCPEKLNRDYGFIEDLHPDLLLTFAYGQLVSSAVLALPSYPPLNLHASLLPKYRGAAPIQYALLNGDAKTGVSLMQMVKAMDAGVVYGVEEVEIAADDDCTSLSQKMVIAAQRLFLAKIDAFCAGKIEPQVQDEDHVSFAPSIKKEEEHLLLAKGPDDFVNQVRALAMTPGGYLLTSDGKPLKIYKASVDARKPSGEPGLIIKADKDEILIAVCGGTVRLELLQRAGKRVMAARDFNNGQKLLGQVLR